MQKKAVRLLTSNSIGTHAVSLFKSLSILNVYDTYHIQVSCFVFRALNGDLPSQFAHYFELKSLIHNYPLRRDNDLFVRPCRTSIRKFTVRFNGVMYWNSLDDSIRNKNNLPMFKNCLKEYLLSLYI